ncbi:hypothetical protein, partial [Dapis sp. BLCC M229]|uniref:hypothetical protein n=1 Tax=Dapis sp. BLCC M229 TaxID=3400188 RepID=UPI003CF472EB
IQLLIIHYQLSMAVSHKESAIFDNPQPAKPTKPASINHLYYQLLIIHYPLSMAVSHKESVIFDKLLCI